MAKVTFGGKPFRAGEFEKSLQAAAVNAVKEGMHARISAIRHPDTEEFPTVQVLGDELGDLRLLIEGSPALLKVVQGRLNEEDRKVAGLMPKERVGPPKAFLSYSFDDRDMAKRIAQALMASGIDTWWAEWEIRAGDSLRQRIDEGLSGCTHFIVLLTPGSIEKPWVKQEMDAGLVRRIGGEARFVALRHGLPASKLPPLLSGMLSPEIGEDFETSIRDLINDIHDIARKPQLGAAPVSTSLPSTGYSKVATAVARVFVEETSDACFGHPQKTVEELATAIDVADDDIVDALHELRDFVSVSHRRVLAKEEMYATFDEYFKEWSPEADALRIAADLINDPTMPEDTSKAAERYSWSPRRMNPALAYLISRKLIRDSKALASGSWLTIWIKKTDETRRFVKSRT